MPKAAAAVRGGETRAGTLGEQCEARLGNCARTAACDQKRGAGPAVQGGEESCRRDQVGVTHKRGIFDISSPGTRQEDYFEAADSGPSMAGGIRVVDNACVMKNAPGISSNSAK